LEIPFLGTPKKIIGMTDILIEEKWSKPMYLLSDKSNGKQKTHLGQRALKGEG
jgi:hypothetical protein